MPAFIRAEAEQLGLQLRQHELALLAEAFPPDAAHIGTEMAKLALTTDPDGRLPEKLAALVGQTQELGIFELLRIFQQNRNAPTAWRRILEDRLAGENMVFAFTAILLREARSLWQCLAGTPPSLAGPIALQKKVLAKKLGFSGTARLWEIALLADKGIKSGERSPDQAFEILAADLFLLFGSQR
jgi:DNA polymerase-3 subunit delta